MSQRIPLYQIDAFTRRCFGGNPAAVMPLEAWPSDELLQAIAGENNLSETAFLVSDMGPADYHLRWFTPTTEVELCGHATLASAWWLFHHGGFAGDTLRFASLSGELAARRDGERVTIDLPLRPSEAANCPELGRALGRAPGQVRRGANWIAVYPDAATIRALTPDFAALKALHPLGVIVTAPGDDCDFVSRYFAPSFGIDEDPVTGSAHADLAPYWRERLGRTRMTARQLSPRGGELMLQLAGERLLLTGDCVLYLAGEARVPV